MQAYENSPSWLTYRDLLKDRFGIQIDTAPAEDWKAIRGHQVHIDDWRPEGQTKGTVVLVHGAGGNGRILAPLADLAVSLGWRALAPDLPGYGITRPSPAFNWEYEEWPLVVAEIADSCDPPVVIMGSSIGGMTAALAARNSRAVDGVLVTTLLDMADPAIFIRAARWRWLGIASLLGFRLVPAIIDRIALPLWLTAPMRAMSSDPAMQNYFVTDPLLGKRRVPSRLFRTMHACKTSVIDPGCPLLLVHPGADAWTPTTMSRPAFDRVRGQKHLLELTNGSHLPLERPAFDELKDAVGSFLSSVLEGRERDDMASRNENRADTGRV